MAIQLSIMQPTGATATYHVIQAVSATNGGTAFAQVNSYVNKAAYTSQNALCNMTVDITPMISSAIVAAPSLWPLIEAYILTTPAFTGGTQVS